MDGAQVGEKTEIADKIADGYELFLCFYKLQNHMASCITIVAWGYAIGLVRRLESECVTLMLIYYFFDPIGINIILEEYIA